MKVQTKTDLAIEVTIQMNSQERSTLVTALNVACKKIRESTGEDRVSQESLALECLEKLREAVFQTYGESHEFA